MTAAPLAIAYAALALLPTVMHAAVAAGAPLGRFTVGGRFPGRLPPPWRVLAVVQAGLLVTMAAVMLSYARVLALPLPDLLIWPVLGITTLSLIANAASPSRPERLLWTPVLLAMLAAAIGVLLTRV